MVLFPPFRSLASGINRNKLGGNLPPLSHAPKSEQLSKLAGLKRHPVAEGGGVGDREKKNTW